MYSTDILNYTKLKYYTPSAEAWQNKLYLIGLIKFMFVATSQKISWLEFM